MHNAGARFRPSEAPRFKFPHASARRMRLGLRASGGDLAVWVVGGDRITLGREEGLQAEGK